MAVYGAVLTEGMVRKAGWSRVALSASANTHHRPLEIAHQIPLVCTVPGRRGFSNGIAEDRELVSQSGVREAYALVAPYITASVLNQRRRERAASRLYEVWLEKLAPHAPSPPPTNTIAPAKIMPPTSSVRSWAAKSSSPSQRGSYDLSP